MTPSDAEPYAGLTRRFLEGQLTADDFQTLIFDAFGEDERRRPSPLARMIERFVIDVDDYVDDPGLRDPTNGDLDAQQLQALAERFLAKAGSTLAS